MKLWDAANGKEIRVLSKQSDWAQALAFTPDGRRLAVGRYDGTLTLFDAATGKRVSELIAPAGPGHREVARGRQMNPAKASPE